MDVLEQLRTRLADRYVLEKEIGRGGMATVYLARDVKHDRDVAVKVLRPELGAAVGSERFLAEIKLTAGLQHPNILPLFDSGSADGILYYVMPYVSGETLRARLEREGKLAVSEAVALARGIASALDHAHRQGVVHRDVKPENVLLSDGVPIVADFGIARAIKAAGATRVTAVGLSLGTPAYMSPEQATGEEDVDRRADIYSLGCVLFEMLVGEPPFRGTSVHQVIAQHLTAPVPSARGLRDTIPPAVDGAMQRAMAKDRDQRFSTATEMSDALIVAPAVEPMPDYSKVAEPITRSTAPLAGRHKEYAELIARLDALAGGHGGMVFVGGEPGVGKTKLAEALLLEARSRGHVCSVGHSYEMDGAPPYLPFVEMLEYTTRTVPPGRLRAALGSAAPEVALMMPRLRQLFPDIPEPLDLPPDQQRHYLFTQYVDYLARGAANVPIVLLFDDLHWADDSSLLLLEHLAAQLTRMRVLVLGTYRDVDLDVSRPFAKCLERLTRQRLADRIALRRMPESDVADLIAKLGAPNPPGALVQAIYAETEGNPFFVEEVFRHLQEEGRVLDAEGRWLPNIRIDSLEVPEGVKLVIGRRLARVSEACRAVLVSAAVIGPRFELAVLEAVEKLDGDAILDALEEAERAGLVIAQQVKRETRYTFAHELIRQTLLGALSVPRRLRRHLRTAEVLERVHAGREAQHASEIAYHYFQSGSADEEKTTRYLLLAGQHALVAGAFDEALANADKAFSVVEDSEPRRRADLLWVRASALRGLGDWERAGAAYFEAFDMLESLGAGDDLLRLTCMLAEMLYFLDAYHERGVDVIQRALAATADVPGTDRVQLMALGGTLRALTGRYAEGKAMSDVAVAMARASGNGEALGMALSERAGLLTNAGEITEAVACAREAVPLLEVTGKRWAIQWAKSRLGNAMRFTGRPAETLALVKDNEPESVRIGHKGALIAYHVARAFCGFQIRGDVAAYTEAAAEADRNFAGFGIWGEMAFMYRAVIAFETDDPAAATMLDGSVERFTFEVWRDFWWGTQFRIMAAFDPARSRAIFAAHSGRLPGAGAPVTIGMYNALPAIIDGLRRLGDHAAAAALFNACVDGVEKGVVTVGLHQGAAMAAAARQDWDVAERWFSEALVRAERDPMVSAHADVRFMRARMLLMRNGAGDRERAHGLLTEAIPLFEKSGRLRGARESRELLAV